MTEKYFLIKEISRLQKSHPADKFAECLAEYLSQWYCPRLRKDADEGRDWEGVPEELREFAPIFNAVLWHHNMSLQIVSLRCRKPEIMKVRMRLMYFLRVRGLMTYAAIGSLFGVGYTTVMHACQVVHRQIDNDINTRKEMEYINRLI